MLSILSKTPPWPGIILPLFFTLAFLFKKDWVKSPIIPVIQIKMVAIITKEISYWKYIIFIKYDVINEMNIPKNKPSHVFFGEIFWFRNVLPNSFPNMYAKVSLDQIINKKKRIFFSKNIELSNGIFKMKNDERTKYVNSRKCFLNTFNFNLFNKIKIAKIVFDINDIDKIKLKIQ